MELVTHGLSGIVASSLGIQQKFGFTGTLALTASTLFPDIDFFFNLITRSIYVRYHRGFTHSIIYLPLFALLLALVFYPFAKGIGFKWLYLICCLGLLVHIGLDLLNSYGTPVLLPFSHIQYSLDLDIILDALVFLPLLLGVIAGRISPVHQRNIALAVIGVIVIGILVRFSQKVGAANLLKTRESVKEVNVFPSGLDSIFNPFVWQGAVRTDTGYSTYNIKNGEIISEQDISYPKETMSGWTGKSRALRDFLNWSRFPYGLVEQTPEGTIIKLSDLRFRYGDKERFALTAKFAKDSMLISERFSFGGND